MRAQLIQLTCLLAAVTAQESAQEHRRRGIAHDEAGRMPEAVAEFERATSAEPHSDGAWNDLGVALMRRGNV